MWVSIHRWYYFFIDLIIIKWKDKVFRKLRIKLKLHKEIKYED